MESTMPPCYGDTEEDTESYKALTLRDLFPMYARFGDSKRNGEVISLSMIDKWIKQAGLKKVTTTDTALCYTKVTKGKKAVTYKEFRDFLDVLADYRNIEVDVLTNKMVKCGPPRSNTSLKDSNPSVYSRLTDSTHFTGTHKKKFDERYRNKGANEPAFTGYVNGYKLAGSYGKKTRRITQDK